MRHVIYGIYREVQFLHAASDDMQCVIEANIKVLGVGAAAPYRRGILGVLYTSVSAPVHRMEVEVTQVDPAKQQRRPFWCLPYSAGSQVAPVGQGAVKCYTKIDWVIIVRQHGTLD